MARRSHEVSLGYILARADEAKTRDGKRNDKMDRIEQLRWRQHEVPVPKQFKKLYGVRADGSDRGIVKLPLINGVLRTVVANLVRSFPLFRVPPADDTKGAELVSEKREKWLQALFQKLDGSAGSRRAHHTALDQAAMFGLAVNKLLYLPDALDKRQFKRREVESGLEDDTAYNQRTSDYLKSAPLPLRWLVPDARTFHPYYFEGELVEVVEISKRPRYELLDRYGDHVTLDPKSGRLMLGESFSESALGAPATGYRDTVDYIEHWYLDTERLNSTIVSYVADEVLLDQIDTHYNRLPYHPFNGVPSSSQAPEYECQGVVDDMLDLVETLDLVFTMWLNWGYLAAYPMGTYEPGPGGVPRDDQDNPLKTFEYKPGLFEVMEPGAKMSWIVAPQTGTDIKELGQQLLEQTNKAALITEAFRGEYPKGAPAWGMAAALVAQRTVFDPLTDNYAGSAGRMAEQVQWLVANRYRQTVYVQGSEKTEGGKVIKGWLGLNAKDIGSYHAVEATINPLSDVQRIQWGQFGQQLYAAGGIAWQEWVEDYLMNSAPEETRKKILREQFRNSDPYKQRLWEQMMVRWQQRQPSPPPLPPEQLLPEAMPPEMAGTAGVEPGGAPGPQPIAGAPAPVAPGPGTSMPLTQQLPPGVQAV